MIARMRSALLLFMAGAALLAAADDPCSSHGHLDAETGSCVCDTPFPEPGQQGFVGLNCSVPVFGSTLNGKDMAAGCSSSGCGSLEPGQWACFSANFSGPPGEGDWHHLTVLLNRCGGRKGGSKPPEGLWSMWERV